MNTKEIPAAFGPTYTWLWNTTVTRDEIVRQIDEMRSAGIRSFYVLGEPENFRPNLRRTYLDPAYLSDEYVDLVKFAADYAKENGMYVWLYNEGGFPSGMVCGKIVEENPDLCIKRLSCEVLHLHAGDVLHLPDGTLSAFDGESRVGDGYAPVMDADIEVYAVARIGGINSDIADERNVGMFLDMTHETLYRTLGERMGTDLVYMFDDEAHMGSWTEGFENLFRETYGYDVEDWLPWISGERAVSTREQALARIDYEMLCGELVRTRYFLPMRQWLRSHGMKSVGHLDQDHESDGFMALHYGNVMNMLRAFDVPGIDVIWSQIAFPNGGGACSGTSQFFPRIASSAARQIGSRQCLSESFAVYGSQLTPDEMRFCVNYQAVKGINLFNFMVISFDRKTAMSLQYRPNYIAENPGMDMLRQINTYTGRLSYILQNTEAVITTALYYPIRSICAGGEYAERAKASFESLGNMLEEAGVCFDVIDEEFVRTARRESDCLHGEYTAYTDIFVPDADFEPEDVLRILSGMSASVRPCIRTNCRSLRARKQSAPDGVYYFLCNVGGVTVTADVAFDEHGTCRMIDLETGDQYDAGRGILSLTLLRGEGRMIFFPDAGSAVPNVPPVPVLREVKKIDRFEARVVRRYILDEKGPRSMKTDLPFHGPEWESDFSGEIAYTCVLNEDLPDGMFAADLGEVRHFARICVNGELRAEATMPPYFVKIGCLKRGDVLTVTVANTIANACAGNPFFEQQDIRDVGPYNRSMQKHERLAMPGGWSGVLTLYTVEANV